MIPERVLFIRLSSLGDVLRTLPVIAAFKSACPQTTVGLLTSSSYAFLRDRLKFIDHFHCWTKDERRHALREIRRLRYQRSYNFHPIFRAGAISACLGIPERYAFGLSLDREGGFFFSNARVNPPRGAHRIDQTTALVRASGIEIQPIQQPFLLSLPELPPAVSTFLSRDHASSKRFAVLVPGSSAGSPEKRWPAASYSELGRQLAARYKLSVIVMPGLGEGELAHEVAGCMDPPGEVAPEWGLGECASLLSRARLVVGGDSGLTHLANAMGVPTVMIFGPTDPAVYSPRFGKFECVGGCAGTGRPHGGSKRRAAPPMSNVSVHQALEACARLLDRTRL